jgi:hypothetical protein
MQAMMIVGFAHASAVEPAVLLLRRISALIDTGVNICAFSAH